MDRFAFRFILHILHGGFQMLTRLMGGRRQLFNAFDHVGSLIPSVASSYTLERLYDTNSLSLIHCIELDTCRVWSGVRFTAWSHAAPG